MPKIYSKPDLKQESGRGPEGGKPGGMGQQKRVGREVMIAIAVIIALLLIFVLYRMARGEPVVGYTTPPAVHHVAGTSQVPAFSFPFCPNGTTSG
jgi:hypothetical protein